MKHNIIWMPLGTTPERLSALVEENDGLPRYFRVDTSSVQKPDENLMKLALRDSAAKQLLMHLTTLGFFLYYNTTDESRLIRHDRVVHHWPAVKEGTFSASDSGIVFQLEEPESGQFDGLVVVFSPINSKPRLSRYFWPSFPKLQKFLAPNTAVLRIADVGGVKGAFYLDTTAAPDNSQRVNEFIAATAREHDVPQEKIVLYGASKGGTGAAYHGLAAGWKFVAVDPIVSDEWYEEHERDYHFTSGSVFPRPKQDVFSELVNEVSCSRRTSDQRSVIVTSSRSPQFTYINRLLGPLFGELAVFDSSNPAIKTHPDVARQTIYIQVMALNALLTGVPMPAGISPVP